jgi:hypothetical protein
VTLAPEIYFHVHCVDKLTRYAQFGEQILLSIPASRPRLCYRQIIAPPELICYPLAQKKINSRGSLWVPVYQRKTSKISMDLFLPSPRDAKSNEGFARIGLLTFCLVWHYNTTGIFTTRRIPSDKNKELKKDPFSLVTNFDRFSRGSDSLLALYFSELCFFARRLLAKACFGGSLSFLFERYPNFSFSSVHCLAVRCLGLISPCLF